MNLYEYKADTTIVVDLLPNKDKNKYGTVGRWIRLENGAVRSIWQKELDRDFRKCTD